MSWTAKWSLASGWLLLKQFLSSLATGETETFYESRDKKKILPNMLNHPSSHSKAPLNRMKNMKSQFYILAGLVK